VGTTIPELQEKLRDAAEMLKAIAHPIRLDIVISLENYEMNVNTLVDTLEIPQAKLSKHLAILHANHIISLRRDGRSHYYSLKNPELAAQLTALVSDRL
jgi:DNA-binding transcriptional ArsR family regulator